MVKWRKNGGIANVLETRPVETSELVIPAAKGIYSPFIFCYAHISINI